ncbi:MAG TPA: tetratricopeptide repeat protein, partial [Gemmataceae bacterium]|nr:tetratricopeptide repeat protein [Gemmataceae bacterium]
TTENCLWCKKLENTTFRDPKLVAWLNERAIVLRLDAEQEPKIAQALRISNYPTMILAAPNGNILSVIEGYMEAPKLLDHLEKFVIAAPGVNTDALARNYQSAGKALALGDIPRALALLRSVVRDSDGLPIQAKAIQKLREVERQAEGQLAQARDLDRNGETLQAMEVLNNLIRNYPDTAAEREGKTLGASLSAKPDNKSQQRSRRAAELLAQAKEEYRTQQFCGCLEKCELIAANYADLLEGTEASRLLAEIKRNPEYLSMACQNLNDHLSSMYLTLAEAWLIKGDMEQATVCLEKIQRDFPGTQHAQTAQAKLAELQTHPDQRTDFKKQP